MANVTDLNVNGKKMTVDADATASLLSVLRNDLHLTGSKYGCGEGQCGACTVLLDGQPVCSCITQVARAAGKREPDSPRASGETREDGGSGRSRSLDLDPNLVRDRAARESVGHGIIEVVHAIAIGISV